jgi:hypothetical protein
VSSTALDLPPYIPVDQSLAKRHGQLHQANSDLDQYLYRLQPPLPLPICTVLRWAFEPVQQGQWLSFRLIITGNL